MSHVAFVKAKLTNTQPWSLTIFMDEDDDELGRNSLIIGPATLWDDKGRHSGRWCVITVLLHESLGTPAAVAGLAARTTAFFYNKDGMRAPASAANRVRVRSLSSFQRSLCRHLFRLAAKAGGYDVLTEYRYLSLALKQLTKLLETSMDSYLLFLSGGDLDDYQVQFVDIATFLIANGVYAVTSEGRVVDGAVIHDVRAKFESMYGPHSTAVEFGHSVEQALSAPLLIYMLMCYTLSSELPLGDGGLVEQAWNSASTLEELTDAQCHYGRASRAVVFDPSTNLLEPYCRIHALFKDLLSELEVAATAAAAHEIGQRFEDAVASDVVREIRRSAFNTGRATAIRVGMRKENKKALEMKHRMFQAIREPSLAVRVPRR